MNNQSRCPKLHSGAKLTLFIAFVMIRPLLADQPKFEEASVKRSDGCIFRNSIDPARIALNGDPLYVIIMEAFQVKKDQVVGPPWIESDCFSVIAKVPEGATKDQIPAMLQSLLAERFHLATHRETRVRQGYSLVLDKGGAKFKASNSETPLPNLPKGRVAFGRGAAAGKMKGSMTMNRLASMLSGTVHSPVEDLTHLEGTYDIDLSWNRDLPSEGGSPRSDIAFADIFTAVRESLGLRLEPRKIPVDVVVIDHVERIPTEN